MDDKPTCDTIYTYSWGITDIQYLWFWNTFFASSFFEPSTHISTCPQRFLPIQMMGGRVSA